ncbi:hypothetical protein LCGC14_1009550 [marine sediment metagenome]|uniref:Uncharacterized protein n=1 Tax=marine sediment metagenome TaxID=412755 RepID=A0A0F9QIX9_9ZZZZ
MEKEEFLKLLPKLILEDNQVKGAIITALSGVVATKDDIKRVIEEFDKRFEAMDKRFETMDKRFERVYERLDNIDLGYGIIAEGIEYSIIKREFKQKGFDLELQIRQHFLDENNYVHPDTNDVEVDVFHIKPNIIGEATLKLAALDKVRIFIRKSEFLEKMYKETFQKYLFCFKVDERIKQELDILLNQFNIELIIPTFD